MKSIKIGIIGSVGIGAALLLVVSLSARAQQSGPLKPPPNMPPPPGTTVGPQVGSGPAATTPTDKRTGATPTNTTASTANLPPPTMPVDDIIKKFAENEDSFKEARGNYTYTQTVIVKDFDPATGEAGGEYRDVRDVTFTPQGKRFENVTYAPPNTLQFLQLTPEDISDLRNIQPFVLTSDQLPLYDVKYVDHEPVDQLTAYVFDVSPKRIEKGHRYFQGKIWVEDKDFAIVKSHGKAVPDEKSNMFPTFDTYRELIAGKYWFPTYTHADDILHFSSQNKMKNGASLTPDQRLVETVRYENYKYFGSTIKIKAVGQDKQ
jgi:hypothetical protein